MPTEVQIFKNGTVLPEDLSTGGPNWDTSGNLNAPGGFTANTGGVNVIYNPRGTNYNEGIRIPRATNNYTSLCLACDSSTSGSISGQYNLIVYPSYENSGNFSIRAKDTDALSIDTSGNVYTGPAGVLNCYTQEQASGGSNGALRIRANSSNNGFLQFVNTAGNIQYSFIKVSTDGALQASGDIVAFVSDERLKTNFKPIENAVDKVLKLRGFTYNFNEIGEGLGFNTSIRHAGVSAQEVQAVLPEAVCPAPASDEYLTVKYDKLVPLLIEAIKELKAEIEELKKR